ncbi:MAG: hypothetical protein EWV55_15545 [Microcystis viridis Mv_BB_P_19951000_S69]|uniref:Uncharacterized protein n=1 Tax=Microcystis viridis Mv_BB_P_19951000_S68D TaxID=2486270 RepID=A0A552I8P5_MICVR|nr:MAG: hypothetical protein EWV55_15545 [Microcystis viridis Mv_BB_P_19951000_S69]TRU72383.1 MAG: hypothetical protein EWV47_15260 [Microcystis viridis Mv_BB_P_19951000_S68]TRU79860.1 MAG: hypothetical protein EWV77_01430 [Microcystis viridis Mv_BB_P_19951000_S68D]TRU88908.1 MAG: hypothetical protein EWV46_05050 [Microcystis viridis Mv_BB_P_19951000_S69D]
MSGVGAKHSDRKSRVSAIGYCPNASPVQIICPYIGLNLLRLFSSCCQFRGLSRMYCRIF